MWVTVLQENLSRGLATVGRAVATRATLPETQNVLIQTDQGRLKLTATNLEIAISTWIGAQIEEEGAVTIPARMLTDFVNSLPAEKVEIDLVKEPVGIKLRCKGFEAQINGIDAENYPPIPTVADGPTVRIPGDAFRGALDRVVFAAATDDSRPVLTGVKIEIEDGMFALAAADGFRLAVEKGKLEESAEREIGVIVPARTMSEVERLLGDGTDSIEFTVTEAKSQALFRLENIEVVTQLVQGTFPDYEKLIPTSHGTRVTIDLAEFQRAARAASIFARDGSGIIRLIMDPGEEGKGTAQVVSRAEEVGDNKATMEVDLEGDASKVAFNSKFLQDVLNVMRGNSVVLETSTPSSPGVFRSPMHDGYVHVVMPMFVQW